MGVPPPPSNIAETPQTHSTSGAGNGRAALGSSLGTHSDDGSVPREGGQGVSLLCRQWPSPAGGVSWGEGLRGAGRGCGWESREGYPRWRWSPCPCVPTSCHCPSCPCAPPPDPRQWQPALHRQKWGGGGTAAAPWRRQKTRCGAVPSPPPRERGLRRVRGGGAAALESKGRLIPTPTNRPPQTPLSVGPPPVTTSLPTPHPAATATTTTTAGHGHSPRDGDTAYLLPWGAWGGRHWLSPLARPPNHPVGCRAGWPGCGRATAGALRRASERA